MSDSTQLEMILDLGTDFISWHSFCQEITNFDQGWVFTPLLQKFPVEFNTKQKIVNLKFCIFVRVKWWQVLESCCIILRISLSLSKFLFVYPCCCISVCNGINSVLCYLLDQSFFSLYPVLTGSNLCSLLRRYIQI